MMVVNLRFSVDAADYIITDQEVKSLESLAWSRNTSGCGGGHVILFLT